MSTNKSDQYYLGAQDSGTNTNHCHLAKKHHISPQTHSYTKVYVSPSSKFSLRRKILSLVQSLFPDLMSFLCPCLCVRLWLQIYLSKGRAPCGILQVNAREILLLFVITSDILSISLGQTTSSVIHTVSGRWLKRPDVTVWQTGNICCPSLGENSQSAGSPRLQ